MGSCRRARGERSASTGGPSTGCAPYDVARLGIGFVPEGQGIFATLTVDENLRVAMRRDDAASAATGSRRVLALFPDLERFRHARAGTLSGGQKQMLAIARAFVNPHAAAPDRRAVEGPGARSWSSTSSPRSAPMKRDRPCVLVEQNFAMARRLATTST